MGPLLLALRGGRIGPASCWRSVLRSGAVRGRRSSGSPGGERRDRLMQNLFSRNLCPTFHGVRGFLIKEHLTRDPVSIWRLLG
ncbi:hypothetical protein FKM82_026844 [Ascaphus truei]